MQARCYRRHIMPEREWNDLSRAIELHDLFQVRSLLATHDIDVNVLDSASGLHPLHHAIDVEIDGMVQRGAISRFDIVQLLLQMGADPYQRNHRGESAIDNPRESGIRVLMDLLARCHELNAVGP
jgi:ankyrin repeat protein